MWYREIHARLGRALTVAGLPEYDRSEEPGTTASPMGPAPSQVLNTEIRTSLITGMEEEQHFYTLKGD